MATKRKRRKTETETDSDQSYEIVDVSYSKSGAKWTVCQPILPPDEAERRHKRMVNVIARFLLDYIDKHPTLSADQIGPFDTEAKAGSRSKAGVKSGQGIYTQPANRAFRFTPLWGFEMPRYWRTVQAP